MWTWSGWASVTCISSSRRTSHLKLHSGIRQMNLKNSCHTFSLCNASQELEKNKVSPIAPPPPKKKCAFLLVTILQKGTRGCTFLTPGNLPKFSRWAPPSYFTLQYLTAFRKFLPCGLIYNSFFLTPDQSHELSPNYSDGSTRFSGASFELHR
jgi:hypothetical protein